MPGHVEALERPAHSAGAERGSARLKGRNERLRASRPTTSGDNPLHFGPMLRLRLARVAHDSVVPMTALTPLLAPDAAFDAARARQRAEMRSNMFVAAMLYGADGSVAVRIRNMSRGGALIECPPGLAEGSPVRLTRGSLSANGHIAWARDNRAGIAFAAAVAVTDWLPCGNKPTGQQRVDAMIHACRAGTAPAPADGPAVRGVTDEVRQQLLEFRDALNLAAADLAADLAVAVHHPIALQSLDVTAQRLEKLAAALAGRDQIPPSTAS